MEVKAKLKYLRISPRKIRLVIDLIKGMEVEKAADQLRFSHKRGAALILKLLNSAMANAENNFNLKKENLYIKKITADEGPKLKRWKPRAFGRATPILKRSSHILLVLEEKKPSKKVVKKKKTKKKKEELKVIKPEEIKAEDVRKEKKPELEKRSFRPFAGFKKIRDKFMRKTGEK